MIQVLEHLRARRRIDLLVCDALAAGERDRTLAHVERCARCGREVAEARALLDAIAADPARSAEPGVPAELIVARVQARVEEALTGRQARLGWRLVALPVTAAAVLAAVALVPRFVPGPETPPPTTGEAAPLAAPVVSEAALARLERSLAREQAARYLSEAQDVLVTLASSPHDCEEDTHRVDVGEEARKSRELLARRALLLDADSAEVAVAERVLSDVERVLRDVAALEACARRRDLDAISREIDRRDLLLKIGLMTRELQG